MSIETQIYNPAHFSVTENGLYVFDYDGVIVGPDENDIYSLPQEPDEEKSLKHAREGLGIACAGMKVGYQRHLIYQAALLKNKRASELGPAFKTFEEACRQAQAFVLTARSGWEATERVRCFLEEREIIPVEMFHLGRVAKYLQLKQLLDEFPDKEVIYLEDSEKHIEDVEKHFTSEDETSNRLKIFHVQRNGAKKDDAELRRIYVEEVDMALRAEKSADHSKLLKQWDRFADASFREKQWMHERLNWMLVIQPLLFTAVGVAIQYGQDCTALPKGVQNCMERNEILTTLRMIAIGLGLLLSTVVLITLAAAGRMHWIWTTKLNLLAEALNQKEAPEMNVPFGTKPHWPARTSSLIAPILASIFVVIWAYLLFHWFETGLAVWLACILIVIVAGILLRAGIMRGL